MESALLVESHIALYVRLKVARHVLGVGHSENRCDETCSDPSVLAAWIDAKRLKIPECLGAIGAALRVDEQH
jgi:hypothetical protein